MKVSKGSASQVMPLFFIALEKLKPVVDPALCPNKP